MSEADEHVRAHLSPSLVAWAFCFPTDPVAMKVIACLPSDLVPKLKELFEMERREHTKAASDLMTLLEGCGLKMDNASTGKG